MRSYILFGLLALGSATPKIEDCAGDCIGQAIVSTGCSSTNTQCICTSESFMSEIEKCLDTNCAGDNQPANALLSAQDFCKAVSEPNEDLRKRGDPPSYGHPPPPPPSYGHKPPPPPPSYGHKQNHHYCKNSKHPWWDFETKKCVTQCKPRQWLYQRGCHKQNGLCKHQKNPFYDHEKKKCVQKCRPGYHVRGGQCQKQHPKCPHQRRPFYHPEKKKCVHKCAPHYGLKKSECQQHHHPHCNKQNPYWNPYQKKCIKHCRHGHYGYKCRPHHPTTTPTPPPYHTPTTTHPHTTNTVY